MKKLLILVAGLQGCAMSPPDPIHECIVSNTEQYRAIIFKIETLSRELEQGYIEKTNYISNCNQGPRGGTLCSNETQHDYVPIDSSEWRNRIHQLERQKSQSLEMASKAIQACFRQRGIDPTAEELANHYGLRLE